MTAEILSIGSELMEGRIADTNAAYLSERLTALGYNVTRHVAVGDRRADIASAIAEIAARSNVAVVTGGLGPTRDDPTREVFARFLDTELIEDPEAARRIKALFAARGIHEPPASNYQQALIPRGALTIQNSTGTAAGFAARAGKCVFFCLPGVPSEMKIMFKDSVEPELRRMNPRAAALTRSLHTFGMPESVIGERLYELMGEDHDPRVATQAHEGIITVRLTTAAADESAARERIAAAERTIRERLGSAIFGADGQTLSEVVVSLLEKWGLTLAVAESCTGGEISARLTDVPGVSRFLKESVIAYSNESKVRRLGVPAKLIEEHGAVSEAVAKAMALGMRATSGVDLAFAVTGIAGPAGGTPDKPVGLVFLALADSTGARCEEARLAGTRYQVRDRAAKRALNMIRLYLEALENG